jgi:hypothetical protein
VLGGYDLSYTVLNPNFFTSSRAPAMACRGYSASAPTSAMVWGFGFCRAAISKNPVAQFASGSGPEGWIWK